MVQASKKKIAIVVDSLASGGSEKVAGILSQVLINDYVVGVISLNNKIVYNYSGVLYNLGLAESNNKIVNRIQKFLKLKKSLKQLNPDYIIDFRTRNRVLLEALLHVLVWPSRKMIYTIHSYNIAWHLPKGRFFIKRYKKGIITVTSTAIKKLLEAKYGFNNVLYLPNTVDKLSVNKLADKKNIKENYIIAIGRLDNEIKQFDQLIKVYKDSDLISKGIQLYILGDGKDRRKLKELIHDLSLEAHVKLLGFISNPYPYIKQAKFLVLCSKVEGFSMSILEALNLKTPVVSFDCKSGPSEILTPNVNGILIKDQDFLSLKKAMNTLANDKTILDALAMNTDQNIEAFSIENNYKLWRQILN